MKFRLGGYGGEFKLGAIKDSNVYKKLVELMDEDDLSISNDIETEDGDTESIDFFDYDDVVCICGATIDDGYLENEDDSNEARTPLSTLNYVQLSTPCIEEYLEGYDDDEEEVYGFFGGISYEKGTFGYVEFPNENFDMKNVVATVVNMDETLSNDLVVNSFYYFDESLLKIVNSIEDFATHTYEEALEDIQEIFDSFYGDLTVFEKYSIEIDFDNFSTTGKSSEVFLFDEEGIQLN